MTQVWQSKTTPQELTIIKQRNTITEDNYISYYFVHKREIIKIIVIVIKDLYIPTSWNNYINPMCPHPKSL